MAAAADRPVPTVPTPTPPSLVVRGVAVRMGTRTLLEGVEIDHVGAGVLGVVGANGSGKTTLLRVVAQLRAVDRGTVVVCGRDIHDADDAPARRDTGFVPHDPIAWGDRSIRENLVQAARIGGTRRRDAIELASAAIDDWGLEHLSGIAVGGLSRGQAQRYSLARADMTAPAVLLLDEPTVGLDDVARTVLESAIDRWRATRLVVITSHERAWLSGAASAMVEVTA